jgi:BON domain-containing protein
MRQVNWRLGVVVVASVLLVGGCNLLNKSKQPADSEITTDIQSKLFQDPTLKSRDIHVTAQNGTVVLSGSVENDLEKAAAERTAQSVTGVRQVIDQLAVAAPATAQAAPAPEPAMEAPIAAAASPTASASRWRRPKRSTHATHAKHTPTPPAAPETAEAAPTPPAAPTPAPVVQQPPEPAPAPKPQPQTVTVSSGTVVSVRMIDSIDSKVNQPGQEFAASLASAVVAGDKVVFPQGSDARVRLVQAKQSGHFEGSSNLQVELISISAGGQAYSVQSGTYTAQGASRGKRTAETVGGGAAIGAIIGAIAGGRKGAAIGAGAGAATGTGVQAATRGARVNIPSETKLDFTLKAPVTVALSPQSTATRP